MNLIPGVLRRNADRVQVEFADGTFLPAPHRGGAVGGADGQNVIYGVRPEHLTIDNTGQGMQTDVGVVEPTGANTEVYSRFCGTDLISIFRERHDFSAGDNLWLMPDHERTHLFDAETGKALVSS
jgi:multiple sugar transport system ATP-binding protein